MNVLKKFMIILFLININNFHASAAEMNFAVSPVIPTNQIDQSKTYFDLKMKPGQKQILKVQIKNNTDKNIVVEAKANSAITNSNGIADYSISNPKVDNTLDIPFTNIAKVKKETKIQAKSEATVEITIEMPKQQFYGVILGGLHFSEEEDGGQAKKEDGSIQIKNKYAYVIGVLLRETDKVIKPDLKLNEIKPTQINARNVVTANLQNIEPAMLKNLSVDAKVYTEQGKKILHETKKENLRMAPNSNFDYAISWDRQAFESGTYRLEMKATDGEQTWDWTRTFTIKDNTAEKLNTTAIDVENDYSIRYFIGGCLFFLLIIFVYFLARRSKKMK
ncbi:cell surface protein [Bacillus sp. AFS029533]|nr:cell surface protein [Bacillus sp. AFS029533]